MRQIRTPVRALLMAAILLPVEAFVFTPQTAQAYVVVRRGVPRHRPRTVVVTTRRRVYARPVYRGTRRRITRRTVRRVTRRHVYY